MALSSSRSLPSRTDRSSCCSAVIGLLFLEGHRRPRCGSARGEEISGRRRDSRVNALPRVTSAYWLSRDRFVPAESASKRSGDRHTLAGGTPHANTPPVLPGQLAGHGAAARCRGHAQSEISARTESRPSSTTDGTVIDLMARSGSFSPCPVNTHTTVDPAGTPCLMRPATDADEAASQKTDSCWARNV